MLIPRFCEPAGRVATRTFTTSSLTRASFGFRQSSRTFAQYASKRPSLTSPQNAFRYGWQTRTFRQPFNYQRFQTSKSLLQRWASRPTFYYEVGGIGLVCGGYYIANLEEVPVSGRRRFNVVSKESETSMGHSMLQRTLQEYANRIMPAYTREHQMVQRVLNRLIPQSGLDNENWEIHVIDDPELNAFVIPGGKVFVFRGMLALCGDDDHLAAVLGHEIAHNVAHHAAERMSLAYLLLPIAFIGFLAGGVDPSITNAVSSLLVQLPGSRKQEAEADYLGLLMMAESCYDPRAAMNLWARMEQMKHDSIPQFISTHPSNHNRLEKIRGWLPEAEAKRESGECGSLAGYADNFRQATGFTRWT